VFSGLPKLADRVFVVGFLIPVLVTIAEALIAFQECRWLSRVGHQLLHSGDLGKLTAFAASVIVAALLLLLINRPIYRSLEGYTGPLAWNPLKQLARAKWRAADAKRRQLLEAAKLAQRNGGPDRDIIAYRIYLRQLRRKYPRKEENALSTSFGNANRAFEEYSASVYDVEAIIIWPRLNALLPKSLIAALDDARSQVNCFANVVFLSVCVLCIRLVAWCGEGISRAIFGPATPYGTASWASVAIGTLGVAALLAIIWACYRMAVERTYAFGDQVKVAFDLYLPQLPAKLGLTYPDDNKGRRDFWAALEETYYFHAPLKGVSYASAAADVDKAIDEDEQLKNGGTDQEDEKEDDSDE
jgi:hypothetical protein